ncbi:MAG: LLM class flavin-dependent oxidoreductase [Limimaricola sp.]
MQRFTTLNHLFPGTTDSSVHFRALRQAGPSFLRAVEDGGIDGVLIFAANRMPNPFAVAQMICAETTRLIPLIAVRADLAHPFEVYTRLLALAEIGERPIAINLVAGSNRSEQVELGDTCPHDVRYARLAEFAAVLTRLVEGGGRCEHSGRHYRVDTSVQMAEPGKIDLRLYVSGSSPPALELAAALDAVRIAPWSGCDGCNRPQGVPLGIIARDSDTAAWEAAETAFPTLRETWTIPEMPGNDSQWRDRLTKLATDQA